MSLHRILIQILLVASATLVTACDAEILFQTDLRGKSDAIGDDTDEDGISDRDELANGLDPRTPDAGDDPDGDGLSNAWEIKLGYDPHVADSGALAGNGVNDCDEDNDADGATNCWEITNGFDPLNASDLTLDADGDGFSNAEEAVAGTDPKAKENHPGPTPSFTTADNDRNVAGLSNNSVFRATLNFCNDGDLVLVSASSDKPADDTGFVACTKAANTLHGKLGSTTEGEQTVYIWRKNAGGIVDSPLEGKIVYDVTGPKGDLSVVSEEVGESVVTITLPTIADYDSQVLRRILSSDCTESRPEEGTGLTVAKTTTSVADTGFEASSPQCYRIFWYDVLGNEGGLAVVLSPPPGPTFVSLGFANGAADAYVNASEHAASTDMPGTLTASSYDAAEYKLAALATTCDQNLTYGAKPKTDSSDFAADGNYKICVKLVGVGGSMAFGESATLKLDTVAPAFTSMALANEALDGTVNSADHALTNDLAGAAAGTGHDTAAYKLAPSATTCDGALVYGAMPKDNSTQFSAAGNYKVCVKLTDAAGNPAAYGFTADFLYNASLPIFVSLGFASGASDAYVSAAEHAASTDMPGTLTASNYDTADYKLAALATTCDQNLTYGAKPKSDSADFGVDGDYKICVKLVGAGGSTTFGESATLKLDTAVPAFTSMALANEALDGAVNSADHALTNDLAAAAVGTGHDTAAYKLATAATTCDGLLLYGAMPKENSTEFGSAGNYKVCVKLTDAAGNPAAYGFTSDFAYDVTAPVFTSLPLANEAVGGFINDAEKAVASDVAGPVSGTGYTTDQYVVVASTTTCDGSLTYGAMPQNPAVTPDGTYKVCAKLSDAAGNSTYGSSSNVVRDTSLPTFTSMGLANAATDATINIADHLLTTDLVSAAVGAGHTVTEYKLVTLATTCDDNLTYGTIPKADSADFGSDGNYKVCVKLSDAAGNPPDFDASATIAYDNTAPVFTSLAFANEAVGGHINAAEHALANDMAGALVGSGYTADTYKLIIGTTACSGLTYGANPKDNSADFGTDGSYKICTRLADAAGNTTFGSTGALVLDTSLPAFTSIALINEAADGKIDPTDHALTNDLAGTLVGTGYTAADYVLVTNATTCNVALVYGTMPKDNSAAFTVDGSYKVCVKLTDAAGNPPAYGASSVIAYDSDGIVACSRSAGHNYYYEGTAVTLTYDCDALISTVTNPDGQKPGWLAVTSATNGTSTQLTYTGTAGAVTGATVVKNWDFKINGDPTTFTPNNGASPAKIVTGDIDTASLASTVDSSAWVGDNTASSYNYSINAAKVYDLQHSITLDALWDGADTDVLLWANSGSTDMHGLTISTPPPACGSSPASPYLCNGATTGTKPTFNGNLALTWRWSYFDQGAYFVDLAPRVTIEGVTVNLPSLGTSGGLAASVDPAVATGTVAGINHIDDPEAAAKYDNNPFPYGVAIDTASSVTAPTVGLLYYATGTAFSALFREVVPSRTANSTSPSVSQAVGGDLVVDSGTSNNQAFSVRTLPSGEWGSVGSVTNGSGSTDLYFARIASGAGSRSSNAVLTTHTAAENNPAVDLSDAYTDSSAGGQRMAVAYAFTNGTQHLRVAKINPSNSTSSDANWAANGTQYDFTGASTIDRVRIKYKADKFYAAYREGTSVKLRRLDATYDAAAVGNEYHTFVQTLISAEWINNTTNVQSYDFDLGVDGANTVIGTVYRSNTDVNKKCYFNWTTDGGTSFPAVTAVAGFTTASNCYYPTIHYNSQSGNFVITYALDDGASAFDVYTTEVKVTGGVGSVVAGRGYPKQIIPNIAVRPLKLATEFYPAANWMAIFYREIGSSNLKLHGYHVPKR